MWRYPYPLLTFWRKLLYICMLLLHHGFIGVLCAFSNVAFVLLYFCNLFVTLPFWRKLLYICMFTCYFTMALSVSFVHFLEETFVGLHWRIWNQVQFHFNSKLSFDTERKQIRPRNSFFDMGPQFFTFVHFLEEAVLMAVYITKALQHVKHVLGVLEWFYMLSEKYFF